MRRCEKLCRSLKQIFDFKVVRQFIGEVKTKALGRIVTVVAKKSGQTVSAGDHFIQELVRTSLKLSWSLSTPRCHSRPV